MNDYLDVRPEAALSLLRVELIPDVTQFVARHIILEVGVMLSEIVINLELPRKAS